MGLCVELVGCAWLLVSLIYHMGSGDDIDINAAVNADVTDSFIF